MQEVEVKARLREPANVMAALERMGCRLSAPIRQDDAVFMPKGENGFATGKRGMNVLRIRKQGGKALFTLKQTVLNELDCIEHECEVSDAEEMTRAIELLGFREVVRVGKLRQKTRYEPYEICVDTVDGLGEFIEVEKLVEEGDSDAIQEELFAFLEKLGVVRADREVHGYDTLTWHMKNGKP